MAHSVKTQEMPAIRKIERNSMTGSQADPAPISAGAALTPSLEKSSASTLI